MLRYIAEGTSLTMASFSGGIAYLTGGRSQSIDSGAVDVICVGGAEDGTYSGTTPFHCRFGKLSVWRARDRPVYLLVNGRYVPEVRMCLHAPSRSARFVHVPDATPLTSAAEGDAASADIPWTLPDGSPCVLSCFPTAAELAAMRLQPESENAVAFAVGRRPRPRGSTAGEAAAAAATPARAPAQVVSATTSSKEQRGDDDDDDSDADSDEPDADTPLTAAAAAASTPTPVTKVVKARIFTWRAQERLVCVDVDGTITKSDAVGHVVSHLGFNSGTWVHPGVAQLLTAVAGRGYRIVYLTARPIEMVELTATLLAKVRQAGVSATASGGASGSTALTPSSGPSSPQPPAAKEEGAGKAALSAQSPEPASTSAKKKLFARLRSGSRGNKAAAAASSAAAAERPALPRSPVASAGASAGSSKDSQDTASTAARGGVDSLTTVPPPPGTAPSQRLSVRAPAGGGGSGDDDDDDEEETISFLDALSPVEQAAADASASAAAAGAWLTPRATMSGNFDGGLFDDVPLEGEVREEEKGGKAPPLVILPEEPTTPRASPVAEPPSPSPTAAPPASSPTKATTTEPTFALPPGPLITAPDMFLKAFTREVVVKKPHLFKIPALQTIASLFTGEGAGFVAGFGNRGTDAAAYRAVGVPPSHVFIVDKAGTITTVSASATALREGSKSSGGGSGAPLSSSSLSYPALCQPAALDALFPAVL